jgi:hypothetical protein
MDGIASIQVEAYQPEELIWGPGAVGPIPMRELLVVLE